MLDLEQPPILDVLLSSRRACLSGIAAAELCAREELLQDRRADYERRAAHYRLTLALVEARIASLPRHAIHPEQAREDTRRLSIARKARQVTWREYGLRMWFLRRVGL
jgi:hypothetical protein